jgi:ADP-heptose:LPS heptosyltransferase
MLNPDPFTTIGVIVGRDLIGDALIKLPFLRALRNAFPQAEISWITSQGPTAFATQLREPTKALIDKIYEQPEWLPVWNQRTSIVEMISKAFAYRPTLAAAAPRFDLLIDTRNRWRDAVYAREIPHKLFIAPALQFLLSEKRPPFLGSRPPLLCDQLIELVELASGTHPVSTGALPVPNDVLEKARKILPKGQVYVGLAPGAGYLEKAWPRYKFEKVAEEQARKGRVPVFILGPQELSWHAELVSTVPSAKFPLQEYEVWGSMAITLDNTLAIGQLLDVAVANDSGVGHMLAAADCPLISLFGPTSPEKLAPRVSRGTIIRAQDFGSPLMRKITWEAVNEAIEKMLAGKPNRSAE